MRALHVKTTLLFLMLTMTLSLSAVAQASLVKWIGKTITQEIIVQAVGYGAEQLMEYFEDSDTENNGNAAYSSQAQASRSRQPVSVTIVNDFPYHMAYFWITNDGYNWYPYMIYPGYHISVNSGPQGTLGIFNGYNVQFISSGGTYYASRLF